MKEDVRVVSLKLQVDRTHKMYKKITTSSDAAKIFTELVGDADRENVVLMGLDNKGFVTHINIVSVGDVNSSIVHPREVFKSALLANSSAIVIGHNHPSGDCEPSEEDKEVSKRLVMAGEILGIRVLDHIVCTNDHEKFHSFKTVIDKFSITFNPRDITIDQIIEPKKVTEGRSDPSSFHDNQKDIERG